MPSDWSHLLSYWSLTSRECVPGEKGVLKKEDSMGSSQYLLAYVYLERLKQLHVALSKTLLWSLFFSFYGNVLESTHLR